MSEQIKMTPYDEATQTRELQMLKSIVPFLERKQQQQIAVLIQYLEIQNTFAVFSKDTPAMAACELPQGSNRRSAMLSAIREYCTPKEQETIDTLLNLFCIIDNYDSIMG